MLGRPPSLQRSPDGRSKRVRSVQLEPHIDALVAEHQKRYNFGSNSAALADLVARGLTTLSMLGAGDEHARAYRGAALKVERELAEVAKRAVDAYVAELGAAVPKVKARK